jgi:hypothetical protein
METETLAPHFPPPGAFLQKNAPEMLIQLISGTFFAKKMANQEGPPYG